jgi:hypothetical protein
MLFFTGGLQTAASRHNYEVAKRVQYQMFTAIVHGLFSTQVPVVIRRQINKLALLLGQSGGGRIAGDHQQKHRIHQAAYPPH